MRGWRLGRSLDGHIRRFDVTGRTLVTDWAPAQLVSFGL